jgi:cytochrome c oxidase cbb3-type subunit 2
MNHGPLLFFGVFFALTVSWFGLVIAPHLQFGQQEMVVIEETGQSYPPARPGEARQGAEVYHANGCQYCHTQQVRPRSTGADLARGWGKRRTVARDYLRDQPVMLGSVRLGPDLANLGARETNAHTLLLKLYNPRIIIPGSTMPRYPYLFEPRRLKPGATPSPDALALPPAFAPGPNLEVVPRPEALALVAYLESLKAEPLFFEVFPSASTNASSAR